MWYPVPLSRAPLTRLGTRHHFEVIVIIKDDAIYDNVVTTGHTISKQSLSAIYSASLAWIVRWEIEWAPHSKQ